MSPDEFREIVREELQPIVRRLDRIESATLILCDRTPGQLPGRRSHIRRDIEAVLGNEGRAMLGPPPGNIADLVREILPGMELTPDLTDRVFLRIEVDPALKASYDDLVVSRGENGEWWVNRTIGWCLRRQTGAQRGDPEASPRSKLIESYTRLDWRGEASESVRWARRGE